ncbi:XdhC family protein [Mucilaginibacter sp. KACC 22063]|uniref:XdhC family protein n=1 Tax=Mucilaginibacter sp. KACC 22063 TaxID=3025666 RepID=UPI002364FD40|nr:XdhC/CoxI family protein [Mucilaginibacter sp. KACC 22063]WDF55651.1 XdhC family protein [Mucilaginibacter sp. KACC 22063]
MKELQDIVRAFEQARLANKQAALATVVHVEGSSYRRSGARMLVTEDGQLTGAISGGCLEGDTLRKARLVIMQQQPMLVTYDTTDDDDAKLGVGLGCNGIIHVLIEPINTADDYHPIKLFQLFLNKREPVVLITIFNIVNRHAPQHGTCMLIEQQGVAYGFIPVKDLESDIKTTADQLLAGNETSSKSYLTDGEYQCFVELLQPALSLVIVGAGNDAIPLMQIAKVLGWQITIADGRANYISTERFPLADRLLVARPNEVVDQLSVDKRTVFMLMTHNYNYDSALLADLLSLDVPYIGVLGPKKRLVRMLDEISAELSENIPTQLHGPAGLDIGSENAEEIALAIVAEIQSVINKRDGLSLKRKVFVHMRESDNITA